jgi:uncharacterized membrane protein
MLAINYVLVSPHVLIVVTLVAVAAVVFSYFIGYERGADELMRNKRAFWKEQQKKLPKATTIKV